MVIHAKTWVEFSESGLFSFIHGLNEMVPKVTPLFITMVLIQEKSVSHLIITWPHQSGTKIYYKIDDL